MKNTKKIIDETIINYINNDRSVESISENQIGGYTLPVNYTELRWTERKKVREQYIEEQNWICMYCQRSLKEPAPEHITSKYIDWSLFPQGFLNHPIHLQHNHKTKMTEGAVHNYCNAVMWQYERR